MAGYGCAQDPADNSLPIHGPLWLEQKMRQHEGLSRQSMGPNSSGTCSLVSTQHSIAH